MSHAPAFSRAVPDRGVPRCLSPCARALTQDDHLSAAVAARVRSLTGPPSAAASRPGSADRHGQSESRSPCSARADALNPVLQRFDRYRGALPAARAAADMSDLGDAKGNAPAKAPCLTRLPMVPGAFEQALGLPAGSLADATLRDDHTGFRAAMYRDESTGRLILVARDTEPHSLVDWMTNTRNGIGLDTPQYEAMRRLAGRLKNQGVTFDLAGYSKGGGLAQEAALVNTSSRVTVFNSAGLHENSLARTDTPSFASLAARTRSFSSDGDFLTFMNQTSDPSQRIRNAQFLRTEIAGEGIGVNPIAVKYLDPADPAAAYPAFGPARTEYLAELDRQIASMRASLAAGQPVTGFPAVHADQFEVVAGSESALADGLGAHRPEPTLGRLVQHRMSAVLEPMERDVACDRALLRDFVAACG